MYHIGNLCKTFHLSRSTLLYYDTIGLLHATARSEANYRLYSEKDRIRLELICMYRDAGVPLEQIKGLLDSGKKDEEFIFKKRLSEINKQIYLLRLQQKIIIGMLRSNAGDKTMLLDQNVFVSLLKASGIQETTLNQLHIEFERTSPDGHQAFLEYLGMSKRDIQSIRDIANAALHNSV